MALATQPLTGFLGRVERATDRRGLHWICTGARVHARVGAVRGNDLARSVTMAAFLAVLPLLLVALAVTSSITRGGHTDVAARVISHLGLKGAAARELTNALQTARRTRRATT